ncbi:hypothetical protein HH310_28740 [Actinoplanes sp. TBRC 11911]|uniref:hypothetical protein n=1 Tax=Actinoplanes sp. TBRC 11911 TaxID=2729386 RepID=UPI00145F8892|nr:hypothetical protein [Actinoplanes sp. TBRC 11911]NMO55160.1 hypothetical protein [Actinoplanes sp. TBRC 11911]
MTSTTPTGNTAASSDPVLSPGLPPRDAEDANANDIRRFVYTWFTLFEHRAPAEQLATHLATGEHLTLVIPGTEPMHDIEQFTAWYKQLLANTQWNFHELSNLRVNYSGDDAYDVTFDVDWQGAVTEASAWPTNLPEQRFRFALRQWWRVMVGPGGALDSPFTIADLVTEAR